VYHIGPLRQLLVRVRWTVDAQPHQVTATVLAVGVGLQRAEPGTGRIEPVHRHRFVDHAHRGARDQFRVAIEIDIFERPSRIAVGIGRALKRLALARR
jgi:hypothetical protein